MDTEIIKLYHCNEEKTINCFIEEDELIFSEHVQDDNWAGQGMYFWDNVGNALYWKKQKMSHVSPDENVLIAECMLFLDRDYFCDLTNFEEEKKFEKMIEKMSSHQISTNESLGQKIDFLCSKFGYKVIKLFGDYPSTPQTDFLNSRNVTNRIKVIYCIKRGCSDILKSRRLKDDE